MAEIQQDPSMEEILASIKRVIQEDPRPPRRPVRVEVASVNSTPAPAMGPVSVPAPAPEEDVLELDQPVEAGEPLISSDAASASRQSLAALSAARPSPASAPVADGGALENVVRDMLRPMLKDWLDQHLPQIVEELVAREIARISGRS